MPTFVPIVPYADHTYADAYFAERFGADTWIALPDNAAKDKALKHATKMMNQIAYCGYKTVFEQVNEFPRNGSTAIPDEVSQACCECALEIVKGNLLESFWGKPNVQQQTIGDTSTTYSNDVNNILRDNYGFISPMAARMMAGWIKDDEVFDLERVK